MIRRMNRKLKIEIIEFRKKRTGLEENYIVSLEMIIEEESILMYLKMNLDYWKIVWKSMTDT